MRRRRHLLRTIRVCPQCGCGYDAFKAMDARGRYCSPGCLEEARRARSGRAGGPDLRPGEAGPSLAGSA